MQKHPDREAWLNALVSELSPFVAEQGYHAAENVRITCGFGSGGTRIKEGSPQLSESWDTSRSGDAHYEIMISPTLSDQMDVAVQVVRQVCRIATGLDQGIRGGFTALAAGLHLEAPFSNPVSGDAFRVAYAPVLALLGEYPHSALDASKRAKQSTRMIKCVCAGCGYTVRVSQKWLALGAPVCPQHLTAMNEV